MSQVTVLLSAIVKSYSNAPISRYYCIWYNDPESDFQRELKAAYSVRRRPTWEINLYLSPRPGVEPGFSALKASVLPLGHRSSIERAFYVLQIILLV